MTQKPLIYLAGPFRRPDPMANTSIACTAGQALRDDLDVAVLIPHLNLIEHLISPRSDQYWLDTTLDLLRHCDAVFRLPGFSQGSDAEEIEATRIGIPVFHSRAALADWVNQWREQNAHEV